MAICPPVSGIAPLMALLYQMIKFQPSNKQDYNLACNQAPAIVVCHWSAHHDPRVGGWGSRAKYTSLRTLFLLERSEKHPYGQIFKIEMFICIKTPMYFKTVTLVTLLGVVWSKLRNKRHSLTSAI